MSDELPCLHVCVTCRIGGSGGNERAPGALLHAAIAARCAGKIALHRVVCLAACDQGCTATIAMPGKWRYLLGHLTPEMADDLIAYAEAYRDAPGGIVLRSRRAPSLAHAILARVPALEQPT